MATSIRDAEGGVATHRDSAPGVATQSFPTCFPGSRLTQVTAYEGNVLPHWTATGVIYHICFRLFDSVPADKLREWDEERAEFSRRQESGVELTEEEIRHLRYLCSEKIEKYLDAGFGSCLLRGDAALGVVRETLLHDNGRIYRLHAYGIMPNHVHVAVAFRDAGDMRNAVAAWKSVSSHRINRLLGRKGELWQVDYYNHIIRTEAEYRHQVSYIFGNDMVESVRWDGEEPQCRRAGCHVGCVATAPSPSQKRTLATSIRDAEGGVATQRRDAEISTGEAAAKRSLEWCGVATQR